VGLDSIHLVKENFAEGICEHGNETSGLSIGKYFLSNTVSLSGTLSHRVMCKAECFLVPTHAFDFLPFAVELKSNFTYLKFCLVLHQICEVCNFVSREVH
jgi:hypothetical protein